MQVKRANYESPGKAGQRGFEDLDCYKLALDIVVNTHGLAKKLRPEEKYDMASQIRRSAKSITANIAEGYGRYHYLDSLRYYSIARGELNETLSHFVNALALTSLVNIEPAKRLKLTLQIKSHKPTPVYLFTCILIYFPL